MKPEKELCTSCGRARAKFCQVWSRIGFGGGFASHDHVCGRCANQARSIMVKQSWDKPVAECPGSEGVRRRYIPIAGPVGSDRTGPDPTLDYGPGADIRHMQKLVKPGT